MDEQWAEEGTMDLMGEDYPQLSMEWALEGLYFKVKMKSKLLYELTSMESENCAAAGEPELSNGEPENHNSIL